MFSALIPIHEIFPSQSWTKSMLVWLIYQGDKPTINSTPELLNYFQPLIQLVKLINSEDV